MRFQKLQIPAFGPFSNLELQFRDKPLDLHVIYGANEAGKSSLLRAIRDLLFGIPAQSADNFLHNYGDLRIKGEIVNQSGSRLMFQRRKGNKNTLLDAEGRQLPDNALHPYLGSVDQAYFSAMFGLGAQELREGAQDLLRGQGEIGAALFSASMGGTPVQKVVAALQEEGEKLFKGRTTSKVSIRPAINNYKDLRRQSREAAVNAEDWERVEQGLAVAEAEMKRLQGEIDTMQRELSWMERCEDAWPSVSRLAEEEQKLALIPPLPTLAADFVIRARNAREAAGRGQRDVQRITAQVEKLKTQLADCQTNPKVMAEGDALDALHQGLGGYREQKRLLDDYKLKLAGIEPHMRATMSNLQLVGDFGDLECRRINRTTQLACEEASRALKQALDDQGNNIRAIEDLKKQIINLKPELQKLPQTNLQQVREALAVAAMATEAAKTLDASEAEVKRLTRETQSQHQLLTWAPVDLDDTARLPVPGMATIRRHQEKMEGIKHEIVIQEKGVGEGEKRSKSFQKELAQLQRQGELPTEEALSNARQYRDHVWELVLAEWKGDGAKEELNENKPLEEVFPQTMIKADGIADQLRLDADAVAQAEEKRSQLKEIQLQINAGRGEIQKLSEELKRCQDDWKNQWSNCGITPQTPSEMEEWREQWNEFRNLLEKLRNSEEALKKKREQISQAKRVLTAVLGQPEEKEYEILFAAARKLVQEGEQAEGQRIQMNKQFEKLERDLAGLEQNSAALVQVVATATANWKTQCEKTGLPDDISPDTGLQLLQERKELMAQFDLWQEISGKLKMVEASFVQYENAVNEKASALGMAAGTIEAMEAALWNALTQARNSQTRHDQLAEQIDAVTEELENAVEQANRAAQAHNDLMQLAGLKTEEELETLLAHMEQRVVIVQQIGSLRNTLSGLARGMTVDEFLIRVRSENPEAMAQRKGQMQQDKKAREDNLKENSETLFRLREDKKKLEQAGDVAADLLQRAEFCAAAIKQDAAAYLRLRLATHLLQSHIEQFRKENQGPLLKKSGEVFRAITRGAFCGLDADFNADDLPVLVGVRSNQARVPVEGLSEGSRDQLYLALRLAALSRYLEEHEPMPLILDDLLITCDNERAKAILPQLAGLAGRTQILLFTHHEHLVELCRQACGEGNFQLHSLATAC